MKGALAFAAALLLSPLPATARDTPLPADATTWTRANGVSLRYELSGHGAATVVLLHELSTSLEVWDEIMPALKGRQVLRYDQRGFGLSQRIDGPYSLDDAVEDLRALLDRLGIKDKVVLVGSTAGGAIALKFAQAHPDRVSGVFALSPAAYMTPQPQRLGPPDMASRPRPSARQAQTELREEIYPARFRAQHPERLARLRALYYSANAESGMAASKALYAVGFADILPQIRCPVEVVATSLFTMRSVASVKEVADAAPQGHFDVIEAGHLAALESPELVTPLLNAFLRRVDAGTGR